MITYDKCQKVRKIIENKCITTVYQPIVSLADGEIFGYEALSRINNEELSIKIEEMFGSADEASLSWELEILCRTKALEGFVDYSNDGKLFININPNIIYDEKFRKGFTKEKLKELGLSEKDIIFEVTEKVARKNDDLLMQSREHYKSQNISIAIDDVASGFAGLKSLLDVKPSFVKIDISVTRDIHKDKVKLLLCKALVDFCKESNIKSIAEGVESKEELYELIKLGVDFAQGYFLGIPSDRPMEINKDKKELISKLNHEWHREKNRNSVYPRVELLCRRVTEFKADEKAEDIYIKLHKEKGIREFVVTEDDEIKGFMTRARFQDIIGGLYEFCMNAKRTLKELVEDEFLCVNYDMTVDKVSRLAMKRPYDRTYNPVVVKKDKKYLGIVTIKDLLKTCSQIDINRALDCNPLTGLPGNIVIEKEITNHILGDKPYCITYYDIDNFKAYNDAYGFEKGDSMLKLLSDTLEKCSCKNEFIGHIGGDDFIVIADYDDKGEEYSKSVMERFSSEVTKLYSKEDVESGSILSKNRNGITERFPIATISIAGVTSQVRKYENLDEFSCDIAKLKKRSKRRVGNHCSWLKV